MNKYGENPKSGAQAGEEEKWLAFHQAYDSAMRAYRRGDDVSRAVNWLYVVSRKDVRPEEREMERINREYGLGVGKSVASEIEIAPRLWKAIQTGELAKSPREALLAENQNPAPRFAPTMPDGSPIPIWEGYPEDQEQPGEKPSRGEEEKPEPKTPGGSEDKLIPGTPPNPENDADFLL